MKHSDVTSQRLLATGKNLEQIKEAKQRSKICENKQTNRSVFTTYHHLVVATFTAGCIAVA